MLSSHMMPAQIDKAIAMADSALANQLQLNKKIADIIAGVSGSFALIAHDSYLFERTNDVKTIIVRMKSNQCLLAELTQKDTLLRPKKRIYRKKLSQPLQKVYEKSQEIHQQMKLDMESLYIFGNLLLDQWAHVVGYIVNDSEPQKWSFAAFVDKIQKRAIRGYWNHSG